MSPSNLTVTAARLVRLLTTSRCCELEEGQALPSGTGAEFVVQQQLGPAVHRLSDSNGNLLVAKRLPSARAEPNCAAARSWLPALGLDAIAPPVLAWSKESGDRWLVMAYLGETVQTAAHMPSIAENAARCLARLHGTAAGTPLVGQLRSRLPDLGKDFHRRSINDAIDEAIRCSHRLPSAVVDSLLQQLGILKSRLLNRLQYLQTANEPRTLLHGDAWPQNMVVDSTGGVRLIDWDRAGTGPAHYDLSAFLLRMDESLRRRALDHYLEAVEGTPGGLAVIEPLEDIGDAFVADEHARLASTALWTLRSLARNEQWAVQRLTAVTEWIAESHDVRPVASGD